MNILQFKGKCLKHSTNRKSWDNCLVYLNAFRRNENVFSFQEWNLSKISGFFPRTIKEVKNYKFNLCIYLMELFVIHVSFKPSNRTYRIQNSEIKVKSLSLHFTFISNIVTVTVYWRKNYFWLICFLGPFFFCCYIKDFGRLVSEFRLSQSQQEQPQSEL